MTEPFILLKWGSLKAWELTEDKDKALVARWYELGVSMSAALQNNTDEQKDIICELLSGFTGYIGNDWDGSVYTPEEAVAYVRNYGRKTS